MKIKQLLGVALLFTLLACQASVEKQEADSQIYFEIAKEYLNASKPDKAVKEADNAIKAYAKNFNARFLKIEALALLKKYPEAFKALKELRKVVPPEKEYLADHWEGVTYMHQGDLRDSAELLEKSAGAKPDFNQNHILLVQVYSRLNNLPKAIEHARSWVELDPASSTALESLGIMLINNKGYDEAKKILDDAIKLNPKSHLAYNYLGRWADEQKIWKEAEKYYLKSAELFPDNPYVYLNLGQMMMVSGDADKAVTYLQKADAINSKIVYVKYWLGRYEEKKGNTDKALEEYKKGLEINPAFSQIRGAVADLAISTNSGFDYAIKLLEEGLTVTPSDTKGFLYDLGKVYLAKGDLAKAMEKAEKTLTMLDDSAKEGKADVHLLKGEILLKLGDKENARKEYRLSVQADPDSKSGKKAKQQLTI